MRYRTLCKPFKIVWSQSQLYFKKTLVLHNRVILREIFFMKRSGATPWDQLSAESRTQPGVFLVVVHFQVKKARRVVALARCRLLFLLGTCQPSAFFTGGNVFTMLPSGFLILYLKIFEHFSLPVPFPCSLFSASPLSSSSQLLVVHTNGRDSSRANIIYNLSSLPQWSLEFGNRKTKQQENLGSQSLERVGNRCVGV